MLPSYNAELSIESYLLRTPVLIPLVVVCEGALREAIHVGHFEYLRK